MIEKRTIELVDKNTLQADVGDKSQLQTDDKSNIVSAINEVKDQVDGFTSSKMLRPNGTNVEESLLSNEASILEQGEIINNLKLSVSNGKSQIAAAITGKGVSASGNDAFNVLSGKIDKITIESLGGKKWATGTYVASQDKLHDFYRVKDPTTSLKQNYIEINISFVPTVIIYRGRYYSNDYFGCYSSLSFMDYTQPNIRFVAYSNSGDQYGGANLVFTNKNVSIGNGVYRLPFNPGTGGFPNVAFDWIAFE